MAINPAERLSLAGKVAPSSPAIQGCREEARVVSGRLTPLALRRRKDHASGNLMLGSGW
jgi:hypothetical protein